MRKSEKTNTDSCTSKRIGKEEMSENAVVAGRINQNLKTMKLQKSISKRCFGSGKP